MAFDADEVIVLSVMLMPSSTFKVPDTFAPVCVTLNLSANEPECVWKKISLDVPDVPSNFITPLTLPPDCWKLIPGVFASFVL